MFDQNFDEPNYDIGGGYDTGGYDQNYGGNGSGNSKTASIKKAMPLIVIAVVALIVLGFVIFFLGSQNKVTINIEEYGGGSVNNPTLTIYQNNQVVYGPERGTSHTVTLASGDYSYTVLSSDYVKKNDTFTVSSDETSQKIVLEKDIDATLRIEVTFDTIYEGQNLNGVVIIEADSEIDDIALLAKDSKKLEALRAVKAALLLAKTGKGSAGADGISIDVEIAILQRLVKQRKESAEIYLEQGRQELADVELFQVEVIKKYLPEQISEEKLIGIIQGIIDRSGATEIKDMGRVMGLASKELAGRAENKQIAVLVKKLLGAGH